ncbi:MAG: hypothetical protein ACRETO_06745 [Gammaproteobacteria bacterium]
MNMKTPILGFAVSALLSISLAGMPAAQADNTVTMNGFMDTSLFSQSEPFFFGNGQNAELPTSSTSQSFSGIDIRNTRVWWDITGPQFNDGWSGKAHLEADFFGGFNGAGPYSSSQATPRLRQAMFIITAPDGGSSVTIGQQWDLMFPIYSVPVSLTHIAFPLGFGTGMIGWRYPGIVWSKDLTGAQDASKWRLDLGAFSGQWNGPGNDTNFETAGNVGLRPQIEGRLYFNSGDLTAYGALHFSHQDLSGVTGTTATPIASSISSWGTTVGVAWHPGSWSLVGAAYDGKGIGQLFASMAQFGDISTKGVFVQGGYKFTSNWAGYLTYATDRPNNADVITWMGAGSAGRLKGQQEAIDLIYSSGPFGVGFEFMHASLESTTNGIDRVTDTGNQESISAIFHF